VSEPHLAELHNPVEVAAQLDAAVDGVAHQVIELRKSGDIAATGQGAAINSLIAASSWLETNGEKALSSHKIAKKPSQNCHRPSSHTLSTSMLLRPLATIS
jgi:hypothetical protein